MKPAIPEPESETNETMTHDNMEHETSRELTISGCGTERR